MTNPYEGNEHVLRDAAFRQFIQAVHEAAGLLRQLGETLRNERVHEALRAWDAYPVSVDKVNAAEVSVLALQDELELAERRDAVLSRGLVGTIQEMSATPMTVAELRERQSSARQHPQEPEHRSF